GAAKFAPGPAVLDPDVAPLRPPGLQQPPRECGGKGLSFLVALDMHHQQPDRPPALSQLRPRRERPRCCAAEQRYECAAVIKKTRSHETIAKCVGLAKRPRSAKGLPFSSSRVGRRPVGNSCVDGPRLARENVTCRAEVACSHVSGLLVQSGWTAGPDGVREPSPHHSNGIDVPMKSQVWLGCVGSTDCAITRHCSLASSRTWLIGLSRRGHALVVLMPVHHRPGDARGLVG